MNKSAWDEDKLNRSDALFYMPSINKFIDGQWYVIHDLKKLFDVWQLDKWKKGCKDSKMIAKDGSAWDICYLNKNEEDEVLDLMSWNASYDIKMDRMVI